MVLSFSRWTSFSGGVLHQLHLLRRAPLDQDAPAVAFETKVVEEPRRHQHRYVAPSEGHQRAGAGVPGGQRVSVMSVFVHSPERRASVAAATGSTVRVVNRMSPWATWPG